MLIWAAVIVVVLSFLAALLAGLLTRGSTSAAPEPSETVAATPTPDETAPGDVSPDEIYPAGSDLRAGQGNPPAGTGADGDVYIDTKTANVWVHRNGNWQQAGNIRDSAAENLKGETGATGAPGEAGAPGAPGTNVVLGVGAPDPLTCENDGDVYIDTPVSDYYSCVDGKWSLFGPGGIVPLNG
jgi:hypothetical protein